MKLPLNAKMADNEGAPAREGGLFPQPPRFSSTGHPDTFEYRLTVETGEQSHTVLFHDQDGHPEALDELADWLRDRKPK